MKTILVIGLLFLGACSNTISGGHGLGQDSRFAMDKTFNETLELAKSGHTQTWYNAQTNTSGTITVISTYVLHGRHCREFTGTIHGTLRTKEFWGDACRWGQYDWRVNWDGLNNSGRVVLQPQTL
tara:strand:+ start:99 stop:473 length:375 start_codon:yes stop_codon:yes gene_type:complete